MVSVIVICVLIHKFSDINSKTYRSFASMAPKIGKQCFSYPLPRTYAPRRKIFYMHMRLRMFK